MDLTKRENKLIGNLSKNELKLFNKVCYKVSPRRWEIDLKHYNETYSIEDALTVIDCQFR